MQTLLDDGLNTAGARDVRAPSRVGSFGQARVSSSSPATNLFTQRTLGSRSCSGWTVPSKPVPTSAARGGSRRCIGIVTSNKAMASKMSGDQQDLIQRLVTQGAAGPSDEHPHGRNVEICKSRVVHDIAISGKGVTDLAARFAQRRLQVCRSVSTSAQ